MKTRDIDIRTSLHFVLKKEHKEEPDTLILDELGLCQGDARIDVAVVNGAINGYEIKSESDTLERLPRQCEVYNKVFDTVTILTASRFIEGIIDIIPEWWGVTRVEMEEDGVVYFYPFREPQRNTQIDPFAVAQLLWRDEALGILKERGLQKGLMSKPRNILWDALAKQLPLKELQDEVRRCLKARPRWRAH
ncbi:sce7726 family protein [Brevibacillus sp. HB2.2]|uniref:sce7726 family protein n=1 Tax=Brevibacillus sp. HB2.2 TaxID=2738846 RepID=UPI00156A870B|nr:sce7726 family protein [Brevibacillus sp. HB2.2]NRS49768.1 sce7726 family protein [Brevibacillus sp. HB2.2]